MNECIDSTMGRIPRMLAVLLARDDPRTSWSFHSSIDQSPSVPIDSPLRIFWMLGLSTIWINLFFVYYEKIRGIYECRCDERLQTKSKEFTRLTYTGLVLYLLVAVVAV